MSADAKAPSTLKGYTLPRTPLGSSSHIPAPPWHFVGDVLVIEYWADPAAAAAALPDGLVPHEDSGRMTAMFVDWQSCSGDGSELLDPVGAQYREFLVTVAATHNGREVAFCPHIVVTADFCLVRGLIQGFPKKLGSVAITRTFGLDLVADPGLWAGSQFAGTAAVADRRVAQATVTLERTTETVSPHFAVPVVNVRYYPRLAASGRTPRRARRRRARTRRHLRPCHVGDLGGDRKLRTFDAPAELHALAPVRVGRGFRFTYGYSINDLRTLEQL
jgi:acetoacetate decarboxylase